MSKPPDDVRSVMRIRHYSCQTEKIYLQSRIAETARPHTLRRSFAAHLLRDGCDIRTTIQGVLGHKDPAATTIYAHVLNQYRPGVKSPADV
jgi:site-specific recombinase XerD